MKMDELETGRQNEARNPGRKSFGLPEQIPAARARPICLWLVDDDSRVRTLLADLLSKSGFLRCARQFASAEAVLAALATETPPEIILMDVNMGGMSGIDAIAPIKSLAGATRVFIMTSFYNSLVASRALDAGALGFFLKVDDIAKIIESVQNETATESAEELFPAYAHQEGAQPAGARAVGAVSSRKMNYLISPISAMGPAEAGNSRPAWFGRVKAMLRGFVILKLQS